MPIGGLPNLFAEADGIICIRTEAEAERIIINLHKLRNFCQFRRPLSSPGYLTSARKRQDFFDGMPRLLFQDRLGKSNLFSKPIFPHRINRGNQSNGKIRLTLMFFIILYSTLQKF